MENAFWTARGDGEQAMSHQDYYQGRLPIADSITRNPFSSPRLQISTMRSSYTDRPLTLAPAPSLPPSPYAHPSPNLPPTTPLPPAPTSNRPSIQHSSARQPSFTIGVPSTHHQSQVSQNPFGVHRHRFIPQPGSPLQFPSTFDQSWRPQSPLSDPLMTPMPQRFNFEDVKARQDICDICKSLHSLYHNPKGQEFDIYNLLLKLKLCLSLTSDDQSNDLSCQTTQKPRRPGRKGSIMCARCRTQRQGSRNPCVSISNCPAGPCKPCVKVCQARTCRMTYPNGETEQERKISQYNILNCKPTGTPEELAMTNAAILDELLADDSLQNILPFAHFQGLQEVARQNRPEQNTSVDLITFHDQNTEMESFEAPHATEPPLQTVPQDDILFDQDTEIHDYFFDAVEALLPDPTDTIEDVAEVRATQFLSARLPDRPEKFGAIVNNVRASRTENRAQAFASKSALWKPDPSQAVYIPASTEDSTDA